MSDDNQNPDVNPDLNTDPEPNPSPDTDSGADPEPDKEKDGVDTILSDPGDDGATAPSVFPENWVEILSDGDEKRAKRLGRFKSPLGLVDWLFNMDKKVRSGQLKEDNPFPDDGTDEDKAAWRKNAGLPEAADGYEMPEGLVVGDEDQPHIGKFLGKMFDRNASPDLVKDAITVYYDIQDDIAAARQEEDLAIKTKGEDKLREELGPKYREFVNDIINFLDMAPPGKVVDGERQPGVKERLMGGRLSDSTPIMSDVETLRFLHYVATELNPAHTVVDPSSGNVLESVETEIATIKDLMRDKQSEYYKGPKAEGTQKRYRELIEAQAKIKGRTKKP